MLRTNLSTRPFYNERSVQALLGAAGLIVLALTLFNLMQIIVLTRHQSDLSTRAASSENRARELRTHAAGVRRTVNPQELASVSSSAREANVLIGQRLFSWTDLLDQLEATLPDDVRITSLRPVTDKDGRILVDMTVVGRRVEDIDQFMRNLDTTGAFTDVFSRNESSTNEGLRQTSIEARYSPK
jgi:Tfp pilus assembly protein PilN